MIEFDFNAKRDAAGTMTPVRNRKTKNTIPLPAKLDS